MLWRRSGAYSQSQALRSWAPSDYATDLKNPASCVLPCQMTWSLLQIFPKSLHLIPTESQEGTHYTGPKCGRQWLTTA